MRNLEGFFFYFPLWILLTILQEIHSISLSTNMNNDLNIMIYQTKEDIKQDLSKIISSISQIEIKNKGYFTIALSGGSLPEMLEELATQNHEWHNWRVFFADERCVDLNHQDSNYLACEKSLFSKIPIPRENIITIQSPHNPEEAADLYEEQFLRLVPDGSLDLILLGVGPDGHTASLFPHHELLSYSGPRHVVPIFDSPKSPSQRITLTLSTINHSKKVIFVATGSSKVATLQSIFSSYQHTSNDFEYLPAALIRTSDGSLPMWVVDEAAVPQRHPTSEDL